MRAGLLLLCLLSATIAWSRVSVDAVGITVSDVDRSIAFYRNVLGFELLEDREVTGDDYEHLFGVFGARIRAARMKLGHEHIELIEFVAPRGRPVPVDSRSNDLWFQHVAIIVSDMARAYDHLRRHDVEHASTGPQRLPDWNPNAGGISAFYFRDPDDNHLEVLSFPPDKGAARWHEPTDALFLGIDHTAIVVEDTERSIAFYRDVLGLHVAGESENYGPEQERLNNVFGARLRITGLAGEGGIGVELLEYLSPRTGRPFPAATQANDLWHWQIQFADDDLGESNEKLNKGAYAWISNGRIAVQDAAFGYRDALMVRDPDGHANLLMKPTGQRQETR